MKKNNLKILEEYSHTMDDLDSQILDLLAKEKDKDDATDKKLRAGLGDFEAAAGSFYGGVEMFYEQALKFLKIANALGKEVFKQGLEIDELKEKIERLNYQSYN